MRALIVTLIAVLVILDITISGILAARRCPEPPPLSFKHRPAMAGSYFPPQP